MKGNKNSYLKKYSKINIAQNTNHRNKWETFRLGDYLYTPEGKGQVNI